MGEPPLIIFQRVLLTEISLAFIRLDSIFELISLLLNQKRFWYSFHATTFLEFYRGPADSLSISRDDRSVDDMQMSSLAFPLNLILIEFNLSFVHGRQKT